MDKIDLEIRRKTRRDFLIGGVAAAAGFGGWRWLKTAPQDNQLSRPLRRVLEFNERVDRVVFSPRHLAPTFSPMLAREPKPNGDIGIDDDDFDPSTWKLDVEGAEEGGPFTLAAIQALPKIEMVTQLNCIEGWTQVVHWAGVRFSDFVAKVVPKTMKYVGMETPDGDYYVGLDGDSAMHPQTMLCYEMNGQPLALNHGAPLRLVIPVKYGIKNLKRIGTIRFTNERPADYWAEQGYDWYAGL